MSSQYLHNIPFFACLSPSELASLEALAEPLLLPTGGQIVEEGGAIDSVYFIRKGTVHVRRTSGDHEVLLARIGEGGFFGEMNLFTAGLASATILGVGKIELTKIPYTKLLAFLETNPSAGYRVVATMLAEMGTRLQQTNDRLLNSLFWAADAE